MRSLRHAAAALIGAALVAAAPPPAAAAAPLERLVERYSPILMLKRNDDLPCGKSGEQYLPASVEIMLGNPDVKLVLRRKGRNVLVKLGPTSSDIAGLDENYYLDEPGVPYRPRCTYARESQRLTRGRRPVVYAHLARQPGLPGLALQYWFYYWFNRFNDLHESDWEGIQLAFEASTVEEALARGPTRVAYAQHGGGELADWDDDKLERRGTHPVVYVSSGSHASQYERALYLGRGRQGSGLGCDDTRPESFAVRPVPILVPHERGRELAHLSRPLGAVRPRVLERRDGPEQEGALGHALCVDVGPAHVDSDHAGLAGGGPDGNRLLLRSGLGPRHRR